MGQGIEMNLEGIRARIKTQQVRFKDVGFHYLNLHIVYPAGFDVALRLTLESVHLAC